MLSTKEKIHVYFMPGLATDRSIFENIQLPEDQFEVHFLEWIIPLKDETLKMYVERMLPYIKNENCVLIGVSFGGVIVQELSSYINAQRLIIISSVKCREELPRRMKFAAKTGSFKLLPTSLLNYLDYIEKLPLHGFLKKRARLYNRYLAVRNQIYLNWSIEKMVLWDCEKARKNVIHIHGDKDMVFPYKYIKGCITVKGGTHIMIINKYRWFNRYLPEIILHGEIKNYKKSKKVEQ